jgi:hypothetical protein
MRYTQVKFKIKALLGLMMIGLSQSSVADKTTQPVWFGIYTSDHSILQVNCTILAFRSMYYQFYVTNLLPVALSKKVIDHTDQFVLDIQKTGFNALVDYRIDWLGGSGGLEYSEYGTAQRNVLISGVANMSGTALKLDCK